MRHVADGSFSTDPASFACSLHQRRLGRTKEALAGDQRGCVAWRLLWIDLVTEIAGLGIDLPVRIQNGGAVRRGYLVGSDLCLPTFAVERPRRARASAEKRA